MHHKEWYKLSLFFVLLLGPAANAQSLPDSISQLAKLAQENSEKFVDSLNSMARTNRWKDSLSINTWSENVRMKINSRFTDARVNAFADSLRLSGLSKEKVRLKSDSVLKKKEALLNETTEKQKALQAKVTSRYQKWTENLRSKFNLDSAGVRSLGASIPANPVSVPGVATQVPEMDFGGSIPEVPPFGLEDFAQLNISPELTSLGAVPTLGELEQLRSTMPQMPNPGTELSKQIGGIEDLAANPEATLEKEVGQVTAVNDATKALEGAEQIKASNELVNASNPLNDPNEAISARKQEAVDHFAGQEVALQGALSQMAKYKKKYSSLGSLSEIKKNDWLPKNGLKGRPFKERFLPGLNLAYRGGNDTLLFDIFPNAAYRITGRIEAGIGANYRLRVMQSPFGFDQHEPVWGMNAFLVFKTVKSVYLRVELDGNSHPVAASSDRAAYRDWRWTFYSGIQTSFKISSRWQGNAQMLYGFDKSLKDGFPERLNARVGVQYKLVK